MRVLAEFRKEERKIPLRSNGFAPATQRQRQLPMEFIAAVMPASE